jgi:hypothetical protein
VNLPEARTQLAPPKPQAGTRRGNGSSLLTGVDGRTTQARRFKEIFANLAQDIGGDPSEAQKAIAARAATLAVWCEQAEVDFASGGELDVLTYSTVSNAMRRLLSDLGLERVSRDVTPSLSDYIAGKGAGP